MPQLELTGEHVARLGDEDLRSLVVKLCEAELRRTGRPSAALLAGGNQTAPDGGVDVRVQLEVSSSGVLTGMLTSTTDASRVPAGSRVTESLLANPGFDFIPRAATGYQVKCEDMPAASITDEMRPKGVLRDSIKDLIARKGAYVIVSSKGTVADAFLAKRHQSMLDAVSDQPGHADLKLDFYDRDRLARWVREYPGVEAWLRDRVNARLRGWHGHGFWAGVDVAYLLDDTARLVERTGAGGAKALSAAEGLERLRTALSMPGQVIRLVGLSGTGKTRFAQALFEKGVGNGEPLDTASVLYTDLGNKPDPSAREMLLRLGALEQRAIVIVDNCNPKAHRILAECVSQFKGLLSLLTVEYDVTDDDTPDATEVYELAPASDQVLEGILVRLVPHLTEPDRHRITECSGGNARIALAVARTVEKGETLGVLKDSELFLRLFRQGQAEDQELLRAAQVCSLVYSFEGIDTKTDASELRVLAKLASMTPNELYRHVGILKRRDLVQVRSKWRAVLPPALANRLAKLALQEIPAIEITEAFAESERLLISFSRRLEYLHDSEEACAIASRWIDDERWLADPTQLNELGRKLFINLAPLVPDKVLAAMEHALFTRSASDFVLRHKYSMHQWCVLIRHLAYQPVSFDRAALLLLTLAEHEDGTNVDCREAWKEMFRIGLSGTLALPAQRAGLLEGLLKASTGKRLEFTWLAIEAMLEVNYITSSHEFSFGARSQGYGWEPKSNEEVVAWFERAFALMRRAAAQGGAGLQRMRTALASHFRAVWGYGVEKQVAALMLELADSGGWPAGWLATRSAVRFDSDVMQVDSLMALKTLDAVMAPKGLAQEVRAYTLGHAGGYLDVAEAVDDLDEAEDRNPVKSWERVNEKVVMLGSALAGVDAVLTQLLPELLSEESGRQHQLGHGLGKGSADKHRHWKMLHDAFVELPGEPNVSLLAGFVHGVRSVDPGSAFAILDSVERDAKLDRYYPVLLGPPQDDADGDRLLASMRRAAAQPPRYYLRMHDGTDGGLSVAKFCEAMELLSQMEDGQMTAIDQLGIEVRQRSARKVAIPAELLALARSMLSRFSFGNRRQNVAWRLNELAKFALSGPDATEAAAQLAAHFVAAMEDFRSHGEDYGDLACTLFKLQPLVSLNAFLSKPTSRPQLGFRSRHAARRGSMLQCAPLEVVLQWVREAPQTRAALVAGTINIFEAKSESGPLQDGGAGAVTLSPLAAQLLELVTDKEPVLQSFSKHLHPSHWSGSLSQTLAPYVELLKTLSVHADTVVADWAKTALKSLQQRIEHDRTMDIFQEQSFE